MPVPKEFPAVVARVDAFFQRVEAQHSQHMQCAKGCSACCLPGLGATTVESQAILDLLPALPAKVRARLQKRVDDPPPDRCVALEKDGSCAIYAARPLVCRSHGVPVRMAGPKGLPVVDACHLNFTALPPSQAGVENILDQTTLSTLLHAVDALHVKNTGGTPGTRHLLVDVLAQGLAGRTNM